jgi:hypothetical protein
MKLKLIALAVAALVSGGANANIIDQGAGTGNGTLLFSIWDANSSFSVNTGVTIDQLSANIVATGVGYSFSDAGLTNWLSTATGPVAWTVFGNDQLGAQRAITTTDGSNAGVTITNGNARSANAANSVFIGNQLNLGDFAAAGVTEAVAASSSAAYIGNSSLAIGLPGYGYNFNSNGSLANSDYATGLGVISINTPNATTAKSTYSTTAPSLAYNGSVAHAWVANNTFTISTVAAVPEADSLAMLLAGMGLVGSIARRRNRKTA